MPSKTKLKNSAIAAKSAALPKISSELIAQFVTGPMTGQAVNAASLRKAPWLSVVADVYGFSGGFTSASQLLPSDFLSAISS